MSKYTVQLRWLVEQYLDDSGLPHTEEMWPSIYSRLGLGDYEIWGNDALPPEVNRRRLNDKIIRHYWFREIGAETAAQFGWLMRRTMMEIMPYYNQLYSSESLVDKPLEDYSRTVHELADASTDSSGSARSVFQDTPMGMLSNEGSPSVENLDYATNVTYDSSQAESETNREREMTDSGHVQSQSKLLKQYRDTFLNIDMDIIAELETLFMGLW